MSHSFLIFDFLISSPSPLGRKQPRIPKHCGAFLYHVMYPHNLKALRTFSVQGIASATLSIALHPIEYFIQISRNNTFFDCCASFAAMIIVLYCILGAELLGLTKIYEIDDFENRTILFLINYYSFSLHSKILLP